MCWKFVVSLLMLPASVIAQDSLSVKVQTIPAKYFQQVTKKSFQYERHIEKRTQKALNRMMRQERKLQAKLVKVNSVAAKSIFENSLDKMITLKKGISAKTMAEAEKLADSNSYLDTLANTLGFLKDVKDLSGNVKHLHAKVGKPLAQVKELQGKLQQAGDVVKFIRSRRELLQSQLGQYGNMSKDLQKINKEIIITINSSRSTSMFLATGRKRRPKRWSCSRKYLPIKILFPEIPKLHDFLAS
ncbi:hypothetical protein ACQKLP_05950 [Chitinophaga sp. NPDC101104]|uniref:hypothetical protein n=1 Tax=Chitinophaga sp. NPDC101104 TaxID=3390561 RepID=UPI003D09551B